MTVQIGIFTNIAGGSIHVLKELQIFLIRAITDFNHCGFAQPVGGDIGANMR